MAVAVLRDAVAYNAAGAHGDATFCVLTRPTTTIPAFILSIHNP